MKNWLRDMKVPFHEDMLKIQLHDLFKLHKPNYKKYVIDEILVKRAYRS